MTISLTDWVSLGTIALTFILFVCITCFVKLLYHSHQLIKQYRLLKEHNDFLKHTIESKLSETHACTAGLSNKLDEILNAIELLESQANAMEDSVNIVKRATLDSKKQAIEPEQEAVKIGYRFMNLK